MEKLARSNMNDITYLQIRGTLYENMVYEPRSGSESTKAHRYNQTDSNVKIILLDHDNKILVDIPPQVLPRICGTFGDPTTLGIRGSLPLHLMV
jgi:hypothetical protein